MTDTIAERVARGAALLDERRPGWAGEIDRERLAMWDCTRCILGQLYRKYHLGICRLFTEYAHADAIAHGFFESIAGNTAEELAALRVAWLAAIAARLAPEPAWQPEPQEAELCLTT